MSRRDRGRKGRAGGVRTTGLPATSGAGATVGRTGWSGTKVADVLLWVAIAITVTGVWRWSVSADSAPITGPGFASAARLMCGSLAFWLIGRAVVRGALMWCRTVDVQSVMHGLTVQLCAVAIGQLAAVCWLVLRSGLHEVSVRWTGMSIPVTGLEIALLLLAALVSLALELRPHKSDPATQPGTRWQSGAVQMASFALLIALICLAVGFREMPRISTLSSDPDNHAFWASMVMRLGVVPWDQGLLGQGSFGYPCGYAALNASWCTLSGISVVDAVTIQPVLQFLFGCMVIAAFVPWCIARPDNPLPAIGGARVLLIALLLMAAYWLVLPYGLQSEFFFGQGTARLSATMCTAITVMAWLAPLSARLSGRDRCIRLATVSASLAVATLLNPISGAVAAIPALAVGLDDCRRVVTRTGTRDSSRVPVLAIVAVMVGFSLLIASDPYYSERVFGGRLADPGTTQTPGDVVEPAAAAPEPIFAAPSVSLWSLLSPSQALSYSLAGSSNSTTVGLVWATGLLVSFVAWALRSPARAFRWIALFPVLGIVHFVALSVRPTVGGPIPLYLIQPYLVDAAEQLGSIIAFCALGTGAACLLQADRLWCRVATHALAIGVSWLPMSAPSSVGPSFTMRPRVTRLDGNMGVPTPSDLEVIEFWNQYAANIVANRPTMTYTEAPKVLVLGVPREIGVEKWVFPAGGGRLLVLGSPLPAAFFYGHGSSEWRYQNYLDRVCGNFDADWLLARNIRYVFIPADARACIAVEESDRSQLFKTIYRSGPSALLEIVGAPD